MKKLRLTPAAIVTPNANGILLQSDLGAFQLHGSDISDFVSRVIPMLDEATHDENAICEELAEYDNSSIKDILTLLAVKGLIEEVLETEAFHPPWQAHSRFISAWPATNKKPASQLSEQKILVIGLEPWSAKMVDELANSGVGTIHILDSEVLSIDDVLCHRPYGEQSIGLPRAQVLCSVLEREAPWSNVSHEALALNTDESLSLTCTHDWDLVIVTLAPEAQYWLSKVSQFVHQQGLKTLYGCLDGLESWLGPVVDSQGDGCWNCLRLRRLGSDKQPEMAHLLERSAFDSQSTRRARSMLSSMAVLTGQQLALEATKLLLAFTESDLYGKVFVQNLVTHESNHHKIIPVPWCDTCGYAHPTNKAANDNTDDAQKPAHYAAMSAVAAYTPNTQNPLNTVKSIDELKALFAGWIDPKMGVIKKFTGHLSDLPEFPRTASANLSSYTAGSYDPRNQGQVGSGKGLDEISAHISAIGEAIERYSAARYHVGNLKYAAINQLHGEYVDPDTLVLYSQKQYASTNFPFSKWKKKQKIHWAKGTWLGTDREVSVPALMTYFNFKCPYEEQFSQVSSNGLAAGQTHEDAAIRATYELIERDAMMLTWYAQLPCQRLQIDSHYTGKMRILIDSLQDKGVALELYVLDVGLHVPTVVCLAFGDGITTPAASVSLATHGDIHVAMQKALLEQGHVMPYLCYLMASNRTRLQSVADVRSLEDHAAYYFSPNHLSAFDFMRQPQSEAMPISQWSYPKVEGIQDLRSRVINAGVDIAVVDVTAPDVHLSPFKVARAVGIHMQPIHFGEQYKRVDNPRLRKLLKGNAVNNNPHPIA